MDNDFPKDHTFSILTFLGSSFSEITLDVKAKLDNNTGSSVHIMLKY
jgi:hypothetical protein